MKRSNGICTECYSIRVFQLRTLPRLAECCDCGHPQYFINMGLFERIYVETLIFLKIIKNDSYPKDLDPKFRRNRK